MALDVVTDFLMWKMRIWLYLLLLDLSSSSILLRL